MILNDLNHFSTLYVPHTINDGGQYVVVTWWSMGMLVNYADAVHLPHCGQEKKDIDYKYMKLLSQFL